ncbi:hypothetical protein TNCV_1682691 [Trichonephila clavipes]|nr:hypothetical protein TNCV_1682691 [Trichonephila clavipes]
MRIPTNGRAFHPIRIPIYPDRASFYGQMAFQKLHHPIIFQEIELNLAKGLAVAKTFHTRLRGDENFIVKSDSRISNKYGSIDGVLKMSFPVRHIIHHPFQYRCPVTLPPEHALKWQLLESHSLPFNIERGLDSIGSKQNQSYGTKN